MRYKKLDEFPNYKVYENGNIVNCRWDQPKILKQTIHRDGYRLVSLCNKDGIRKQHKVHRIVAMAFHSIPSDEHNQVNHKDLNKANNHVDNLEWVTPSQNIKHMHDAHWIRIMNK